MAAKQFGGETSIGVIAEGKMSEGCTRGKMSLVVTRNTVFLVLGLAISVDRRLECYHGDNYGRKRRVLCKGQNTLHQFPHIANSYVTSWRLPRCVATKSVTSPQHK